MGLKKLMSKRFLLNLIFISLTGRCLIVWFKFTALFLEWSTPVHLLTGDTQVLKPS